MGIPGWLPLTARVSGLSAFAHLMRDSGVRLPAALAVAIAIPLILLFWLQFRSISDLSESSAVVLGQLSRHAVDNIAHSLEETLQKPRNELSVRLPTAAFEPLDVPVIEGTFAVTLATHSFVTRLYLWSARDGVYRGELLAYDRARPALHRNVPEAAELLRSVRQLSRHKQPRNAFTLTIDGRPAYVQAQIRYAEPERERMTSFFAFAVDAEYLRHKYLPGLMSSLASAWQAPTGFPPLAVTLLDQSGRVIFPAGGSPSTPFVSEREVPLLFLTGGTLLDGASFATPPEVWRLRTGYGEQTIAGIVSARERSQQALMLLLAVAMAVGVLFVARAAAGEVRLAQRKSDFVLSVSHDLKTPLAHIQLFAESLELGRVKNPERAYEYYAIIRRQAEKLTRLINNILDFSKIEAGQRHYRREQLDLAAMTRQVLDSFDGLNGFRVRFVAAHEPVWTLIDEEAARQAVENLVSNAMKYSVDARDILLEVDRVDSYARVRVTDRGIGIPRRLQRKIFRKFYRVEDGSGSGAPGCGLGLAIVQHVMQAHGGFVSVESEPGRGSTFTLHFPVHEGAEQTHEADLGDRGRAADVARLA